MRSLLAQPSQVVSVEKKVMDALLGKFRRKLISFCKLGETFNYVQPSPLASTLYYPKVKPLINKLSKSSPPLLNKGEDRECLGSAKHSLTSPIMHHKKFIQSIEPPPYQHSLGHLHQESDVDGENYNGLLLVPSQFARLIISDMSTCLSAKVKNYSEHWPLVDALNQTTT